MSAVLQRRGNKITDGSSHTFRSHFLAEGVPPVVIWSCKGAEPAEVAVENMECESENEGNHMPEVRGPRNRVPEAWHGIVSDESYKKYKEVRAIALLALRGQSEHQPVPAEGAEVSPSGVDAALEEMVAEGVAEAAARDAFLREMNSNEPTEWQSLMPSWAKALLEGVGGGVPFEPQRAQTTSCLADEMDALRVRIDSSLRQPSLALRKVAHCAVLLYKAPFESSRSDIMVAKLFSLLAGEEYRAHNGQLFAYANGAWARTSSITYKTAEDIVQTLMLTEVCFMLLNNVDPERCEASLLVELKIVLGLLSSRDPTGYPSQGSCEEARGRMAHLGDVQLQLPPQDLRREIEFCLREVREVGRQTSTCHGQHGCELPRWLPGHLRHAGVAGDVVA